VFATSNVPISLIVFRRCGANGVGGGGGGGGGNDNEGMNGGWMGQDVVSTYRMRRIEVFLNPFFILFSSSQVFWDGGGGLLYSFACSLACSAFN